MARTEVLTIANLKPFHNSPRFRVTFTDGQTAQTESGSQVNYCIENSEYQDTPVEVTFNSKGLITHVRPVAS